MHGICSWNRRVMCNSKQWLDVHIAELDVLLSLEKSVPLSTMFEKLPNLSSLDGNLFFYENLLTTTKNITTHDGNNQKGQYYRYLQWTHYTSKNIGERCCTLHHVFKRSRPFFAESGAHIRQNFMCSYECLKEYEGKRRGRNSPSCHPIDLGLGRAHGGAGRPREAMTRRRYKGEDGGGAGLPAPALRSQALLDFHQETVKRYARG